MSESAFTAEIWTIIGVGLALSSIGTAGFTLLWRYIAAAETRSENRAAAAETRSENRAAAAEKRAEERSTAIEKRTEARLAELKADLKADIRTLADRMEGNHADLRHAIDTLILT